MLEKTTKWLSIARRKEIVFSSLRVAAFVGTMLALINHFDKLLIWKFQALDVIKIIVTYSVPYMVSTFAAVQTVIRQQKSDSEISGG